jgi:hypothetical protein
MISMRNTHIKHDKNIFERTFSTHVHNFVVFGCQYNLPANACELFRSKKLLLRKIPKKKCKSKMKNIKIEVIRLNFFIRNFLHG